MAEVPAEYAAAIRRYGPLADAEARKWGLSGAELLAKLLSGESGFRMNAVSSANARGAAQFIPSTRQAFIKRYGVDPWASVDQAVKGAALFMRDSGLRGYNPGGGQGYLSYILGQKIDGLAGGVGAVAEGLPGPGDVIGGGAGLITDAIRGSATKALLYVLLVGGGTFLAAEGIARMAGASGRADQAKGAAEQAALLYVTKGASAAA